MDVSLNENIETNNTGPSHDLLMSLTCSVCLGIYKSPVLLPQCGHSFCAGCIRQLASAKFQNSFGPIKLPCPECRTVTTIRNKRLERLPRNEQLNKAVKFYRESNLSKRIPAKFPSAICPHLSSVLDPSLCKHCGNSFCNICLFRHSERIRLELNWGTGGFEKRYKAVGDKCDQTFDKVKSLMEAQIESTQQKIKEENAAFLKSVAEAVLDYERRAFDSIRKVADKQLESIQKSVESTKSSRESLEELTAKLKLLNQSSLIFFPVDKLFETFENAMKIDKNIIALETLVTEQFQPSIEPRKCAVFDNILRRLAKVNVQLKTNKFEESAGLKNRKVMREIELVHKAASNGDLKSLKSILERPVLAPACRRFALEHHGECLTDKIKFSPLIEAAQNGHLEVVKFFIEEFNVHSTEVTENKEFHAVAIKLAAEKGHFDVVKYLVEKSTSPTSSTAPTSESNSNNRKRKISAGSDDDSLPSSKRSNLQLASALNSAISCNQIEIARYLISQHSGKENDIPSTSSTAKLLYLSAGKGQTEAVGFLLNEMKIPIQTLFFINNRTPLHAASAAGHLEIVEMLVEKGANLSAMSKSMGDHKGMPIHVAAAKGQVDVVRYFIDKKPELLKAKSNDGRNLMQVAKLYDQTEIVELVKDKMTEYKVEDTAQVDEPFRPFLIAEGSSSDSEQSFSEDSTFESENESDFELEEISFGDSEESEESTESEDDDDDDDDDDDGPSN